MPAHNQGRHELGQNFLIDQTVIDTVIGLVARTKGPIIEIGSGDGALTLPLQRLRRPLTGVEIDSRRAHRLAERTEPTTTIVNADFLRYRTPKQQHVLVGNLPFHLTTALLRRLLHTREWTDAVLLIQWEVARRRAGVGGATMMTAQWWPWFEFGLVRRVPACAFRPRPTVDGGVLTIARRPGPMLESSEQQRFQALVHRIFTGRGRGLRQIIGTARPGLPKQQLHRWLHEQRIAPTTLPKDLTADQWVSLHHLTT